MASEHRLQENASTLVHLFKDKRLLIFIHKYTVLELFKYLHIP